MRLQLGKGRTIDPSNPDFRALELTDLASWLERNQRWGGKTSVPFSVLRHLLLVDAILPDLTDAPVSVEQRIGALLHDAHEGVLGFDLASPLKPSWPGLEKIEKAIDEGLGLHFGFDPAWLHDPLVKRADLAAAAAEAVAFDMSTDWIEPGREAWSTHVVKARQIAAQDDAHLLWACIVADLLDGVRR